MTPHAFAKLAATTAGAVFIAGLLYAAHNSWSAGIVSGEPVLPALARQAGDITSIELRQAGQVLTLRRAAAGDGWGIAERDGFPVKAEKVRKLMLDLAEARLVEAKTRLPEKYALLELEDTAVKDAKSRSVRLATASTTLGEVVVGKTTPEAFGVGKGGIYIRKPGDPQTWLADKAPEILLAVRDWVDRSIVVVDATKQKAVTIPQPSGEPLRIAAKTKDGKPDGFEFAEPVPAGKKLKGGESADAIARTFGILDLDDVRKAAAPAAGETVRTASLETTEGMTLAYEIVRDKDAAWLKVTATGSADAVKEQVAAIAKRTSGWQFKIAGTTADQLLKSRADLYEDEAKDKDGQPKK